MQFLAMHTHHAVQNVDLEITKLSGSIGAVIEVLGGEYYGGILSGIERIARERGARLLVFRGTPGDVAAAPFAREVQGWIVVHSPVGLPALARQGLPLVTVAYHDPEVGCPAVLADNTEGVRGAVRHLIAHGFRRGSIASVKLPRSPETAVVLLGILKAGGSYALIDEDEQSAGSWPPGISFTQKADGDELRCLAIDLSAALEQSPQSCANLPILTRGSDVACVHAGRRDARRHQVN